MIELRDERGFADHGWLMINEDGDAGAYLSTRLRKGLQMRFDTPTRD